VTREAIEDKLLSLGLDSKDLFSRDRYELISCIIIWKECADRLLAQNKMIDELKDVAAKLLPTVEAAYWDHSSAGHLPGSGYNHSCYSKLPFGWRDTKEAEKFFKRANELSVPAPEAGAKE